MGWRQVATGGFSRDGRDRPPGFDESESVAGGLAYDAGLAMRLAFDEPHVLRSGTIGESWFAVAGRIVAHGVPSRYDGLPIREISLITLVVARPDPDDQIIARHAEPERMAWMHGNFTDHARVADLGDADSYATRLFDYEHSGHDQVAWVIDRLRADPSSRSATITTFQPHTDTTYIPCVSMLDFWLPDGAVELVVYAHSIDFGAKGYGNLVELASLQRRVAGALGVPVGRLVMIVKSAHVYETELEYVKGVLAGTGRSRIDV
jgi:thymidylate synthase